VNAVGVSQHVSLHLSIVSLADTSLMSSKGNNRTVM